MKKQFWAVAALTLLMPMTAAAAYIGSGWMTIGYTDPYVQTTGNTYYGDYDKTSYSRTAGATIDFASPEVFCVEPVNLITSTTYDF